MATLKDDAASRPLPTGRDDEEGLFSRDINGQLVRLDRPTEGDYERRVTVQIDGQPVTVPVAEPLKDAEGNIVFDAQERMTPRFTTIYDAALKLYVKQPGDELKLPIPTLCHLPHMTPVAVCRMCVVQVYGQKRGKRSAERKLLPACQHQVKEGMEVFTMNAKTPEGEPTEDARRVRRSVGVLTELLSADHLKPAPSPAPAEKLSPYNELGRMATSMCGGNASRFALPQFKAPVIDENAEERSTRKHRPLDRSSSVFLVDHSACILCDRCTRACDDVKQNHVIGRVGKGAGAGIGFDLDVPMGNSSCVQCGECMVSCPTSAITFRPAAVALPGKGHEAAPLSVEDLLSEPLFASVPPKFLLWQQGLALRRTVKPGEVLCRQGDPGNTAYMLRSGQVQITVWPPPADEEKLPRRLLGLFPAHKPAMKPIVQLVRTREHQMVGEMACISGTPRSADVTAIDAGEVWEIRRNILDRMMRTPAGREWLQARYRGHAIDEVLKSSKLFAGMPEEEYQRCVTFLRPRLTFVSVGPTQTLFKQGDWADDGMYFVRLGHVRVQIDRIGREARVLYRNPGFSMGEIGLLALVPEDLAKGVEKLDKEIDEALKGLTPEELSSALPAGRRSATCSALDHLEVMRIGRSDILQLLQNFPTARRNLVTLSLNLLKGDLEAGSPLMRQYIEQGLYEGQSLLVLDLDRCTRCDECTKACVQQHGTDSHGVPVTRLLREGLRFDRFLVATSCRSCVDAHCMVGCPVDAIHRGRHKQIVIEDHCIGCGLCAENCPYGNIAMLPNEKRLLEVDDPDHAGGTRMVAQRKASTCDQCDAHSEHDKPVPRCVHACPHDAAHRMTGPQLLARVNNGSRAI